VQELCQIVQDFGILSENYIISGKLDSGLQAHSHRRSLRCVLMYSGMFCEVLVNILSGTRQGFFFRLALESPEARM
jgi:hypothetical protein